MELYANAYQQLSSISAVLGGLAFAAAAALLAAGAATNVLDRPARITAGMAVVSAVCLILAALTWSLMAADLSRAAASNAAPSTVRAIVSMNWIPSIVMIGGILLFFVSIGASGWIASRRLGLLTSAAGAVGIIATVLLVLLFGDININ